MRARFWKALSDLRETFWLLPAILVSLSILLALSLIAVDRSGVLSDEFLASTWIYNGGSSGARDLLGAIASSTIGVAGTVFSITIAALSLAAGQMGPRLLRNFTRDLGNQVTLGTFLGTFAYALIVLRSVRTVDEGDFIPHVALSVGIVLALVCVAMLVYFVGHIAGRINVDTVIALVDRELQDAVQRLTRDKPESAAGDPGPSTEASLIRDPRRGYLQHLDKSGLAQWAFDHNCTVRLLVRPGDYVFPGAPIALVEPSQDGVDQAIRDATALGHIRVSSADLEFAVRQLVEVAVRALSPGINDPNTAIGVLDRLGSTLCDLATRHLPHGVTRVDDHICLVVPVVDYDGLVDAMFNMIRQNAATNPAVLIRMLDVLAAVIQCEFVDVRRKSLSRHAKLVLGDGERHISAPDDVCALQGRHLQFCEYRDDDRYLRKTAAVD